MKLRGMSRVHSHGVQKVDGPCSALDTSTEKDIQKALQHLMEGRSSLSIAHRLSVRNRYPLAVGV